MKSSGSRYRPLIACVIMIGLYFAIPLRRGDFTGPMVAVRVVATLAGFVLVVRLVAKQVRRALNDHWALADRVWTLLTIVTLVVVFFASIYYVMAVHFHGLATRLDSLYFAVVTLCTVGFGDIVPVGQVARAVVTVQMLFDLVIVTSAISIVVGALRLRL